MTDGNYKEIAALKTEITLLKNEILISDEEIKETEEKARVLIEMNKGQDSFLDEAREKLQNILNEQMKLQAENSQIEDEVRKILRNQQKLKIR